MKDIRAQAKRTGANKIGIDEIDAEVAAVRVGKKGTNSRRAS